MDIAGRQISLSVPEHNGNRYTWTMLDALPEGVYLLSIQQGGNQQVVRVVKMGW
jgi:hypothetical protein